MVRQFPGCDQQDHASSLPALAASPSPDRAPGHRSCFCDVVIHMTDVPASRDAELHSTRALGAGFNRGPARRHSGGLPDITLVDRGSTHLGQRSHGPTHAPPGATFQGVENLALNLTHIGIETCGQTGLHPGRDEQARRSEGANLAGPYCEEDTVVTKVRTSSWQKLNVLSVAALGASCLLLSGVGCTPVPSGVAVDDSQVKALLRPAAEITEDALIRGEDGKLYYAATLARKPVSAFKQSYLADLEERGFHFEVERSSPHQPVSRVTGYSVSIVQEASPRPYTIRYKQARDGDPNRRSGVSLLRGDYPPPERVSGRHLVFRLGRHFLDPWRSVVVVPEADMQELPFEMPRPNGVIVRAVEPRTVTPISEKGSPEGPRLDSVDVYFVTKRPAAEIFGFYRQALSPWASLFKKRPEEFSFKFGDRLPPWAPQEVDFLAGSLDNYLYARDGIAIARYSPERYGAPPLPGDAPRWKSLKNLPKDVSVFRIAVVFRHGDKTK